MVALFKRRDRLMCIGLDDALSLLLSLGFRESGAISLKQVSIALSFASNNAFFMQH